MQSVGVFRRKPKTWLHTKAIRGSSSRQIQTHKKHVVSQQCILNKTCSDGVCIVLSLKYFNNRHGVVPFSTGKNVNPQWTPNVFIKGSILPCAEISVSFQHFTRKYPLLSLKNIINGVIFISWGRILFCIGFQTWGTVHSLWLISKHLRDVNLVFPITRIQGHWELKTVLYYQW